MSLRELIETKNEIEEEIIHMKVRIKLAKILEVFKGRGRTVVPMEELIEEIDKLWIVTNVVKKQNCSPLRIIGILNLMRVVYVEIRLIQ